MGVCQHSKHKAPCILSSGKCAPLASFCSCRDVVVAECRFLEAHERYTLKCSSGPKPVGPSNTGPVYRVHIFIFIGFAIGQLLSACYFFGVSAVPPNSVVLGVILVSRARRAPADGGQIVGKAGAFQVPRSVSARFRLVSLSPPLVRAMRGSLQSMMHQETKDVDDLESKAGCGACVCATRPARNI